MEEQEELSAGIQYVPKDALIPLQVGSGFLQRLQKMLIFMVEGRTPEEIEVLKEHFEQNSVPEDTWMFHYQTLQTLIITIEQTAVDKNLTILKPE